MNIAIIGAGNMAYSIGNLLVKGNNQVTVYNRDSQKATELAEKLGNNSQGKGLGDEITEEMVILALPYQAVLEVAQNLGKQFENKIVVDISNPVDFQRWELLTPEGSSGAEELAKKLPPSVKVVKAFNTTFAGMLLKGEIEGKKLDVFIASDNREAAETVVSLVNQAGLRGIDVGPLRRTRALEGMQLIQMSLQEKLGTGWKSAIKILG